MSDPSSTSAPGPEPAPREPASPAPEPQDDAGAQALSEALRSSFAIVKVIMIGLLGLFLFSGFFTVGSQERAVKLRFGVPVGGGDGQLLGPGPHWAFPPPIDEVVRIPVGQVQRVNSSVGWYATTAAGEAVDSEPTPGNSLHPVREGYFVTGDVNIIHARATLSYRIAEPGLRYMLDFASSSNVVRNAFNNALLYAAARYRVDDALTRDQAGFRELARERMEQFVRAHDLGITDLLVDNVRLIPPRYLQQFFDDVSAAEIDRSKRLNEARSHESQTLSRARADAEGRKDLAHAMSKRFVEIVAAEVERFTNNLPAYRSNPELFLHQRQAATLRAVYTNALEKTLVPARGAGADRTLWLQISREPPKPATKTLEPARDDH